MNDHIKGVREMYFFRRKEVKNLKILPYCAEGSSRVNPALNNLEAQRHGTFFL